MSHYKFVLYRMRYTQGPCYAICHEPPTASAPLEAWRLFQIY